jgi:hypothetical protein
MNSAPRPDTEELIERASLGDPTALPELMVRHRGRLRKMVPVRLYRRVAAYVDPSEVVQAPTADVPRRSRPRNRGLTPAHFVITV